MFGSDTLPPLIRRYEAAWSDARGGTNRGTGRSRRESSSWTTPVCACRSTTRARSRSPRQRVQRDAPQDRRVGRAPRRDEVGLGSTGRLSAETSRSLLGHRSGRGLMDRAVRPYPIEGRTALRTHRGAPRAHAAGTEPTVCRTTLAASRESGLARKTGLGSSDGCSPGRSTRRSRAIHGPARSDREPKGAQSSCADCSAASVRQPTFIQRRRDAAFRGTSAIGVE